LSIYPLYFSDEHQLLIYQTDEMTGHSMLRTFNITDNTKQVSELDLGYIIKASLSPNGEWIALFKRQNSRESESNTVSLTFVRTDDLQQSVFIQSEFPVLTDEPPLYHWQGNNSVWVSHGSGYAVFDLALESVTEQATGCIEPSAVSSNVNSQGLKVSVGDGEKDGLIITQETPDYYCKS